MLLWIALACQPPAAEDSTTEPPGPDWPEVENPVAEPSFTADEVMARLDEALALGLPEARTMQEAYLNLLTYGDPACPGTELFITDQFLRGCTSDAGAWYAGITEYYDTAESKLSWNLHDWILMADIEILDPEGQLFALGGHVAEQRAQGFDSLELIWTGQLKGAMFWEGDPQRYTTLVSALLDTWVYRDANGSTRVWYEGGVSWKDYQLSMIALQITNQSCGWSPTGTLMMRDPGGAWYSMVFDGDCSACTTLTFGDGLDMGEVCPNLQPLVEQALAQANRP